MAPHRRRSAVRRTHEAEDLDDSSIDLAPAVNEHQWQELRELGYIGPAPCSSPQAEQILQQWRRKASSPAPSKEHP